MRSANSGWLSVKQACRRLKVSRTPLFRMIDQGELPAYKMGWMIRLRVADVEAYEREHPGDVSR